VLANYKISTNRKKRTKIITKILTIKMWYFLSEGTTLYVITTDDTFLQFFHLLGVHYYN